MTVIKKILDVKALEAQLQENEVLQFLFKSNYTPTDKSSRERGTCKNGHFVFVPNSMGFDPNTHTMIKCNECEEIVFEAKPYAVRTRELDLQEVLHCCKSCKELSQTFHPDDDWFCRKNHVGFVITKANECPDYSKKD